MTATQNRTAALAALITQINALVDQAAANGHLSVTTQTLYANQNDHLIANGYAVNLLNGIYTISWNILT